MVRMCCAAWHSGASCGSVVLQAPSRSRVSLSSRHFAWRQTASEASGSGSWPCRSRGAPWMRLPARPGRTSTWTASASYLVNPPPGYTVLAGSLGIINIPAFGVHMPMLVQDFNVGAQLHNYFSFAATVSQPLFTWGKIRNAIDAAALQVDSAGSDLLAQRRTSSGKCAVHTTAPSLPVVGDGAAGDRRGGSTGGGRPPGRSGPGHPHQGAVLEAAARLRTGGCTAHGGRPGKATALESLGILTGMDPAVIVLATGFQDPPGPVDEDVLNRARRVHGTSPRPRTRQARRRRSSLREGRSRSCARILPGCEGGRVRPGGLPGLEWNWNNTTWNATSCQPGVKMSISTPGVRARIGQAERTRMPEGPAPGGRHHPARCPQGGRGGGEVGRTPLKKAGAGGLAQERLKNAQVSAERRRPAGTICTGPTSWRDRGAGPPACAFTREEAGRPGAPDGGTAVRRTR